MGDKEVSIARRPSDRRIGGLLLVFFAALYLLTASGHLYSPDGEFAYRMSRALIADPTHDYLIKMRKSLSQWGIGVPILSQPVIVPANALAQVMPRKDQVTIDGNTYTLGLYTSGDPSGGSPTVGPANAGVDDTYVLPIENAQPATSLAMVSFLSLSKDVTQGTEVAEITVIDGSGKSTTFPLRAGVETAEWSRGRTAPPIKHGMARVAGIWSGNTGGRSYFAELPLGGTIQPREIRVQYLDGQGRLYIQSLALINQKTGSFTELPGMKPSWSDRENEEYFTLLFYGAYNALITALTCAVLFAFARLLGYGRRVTIVAALVYGLATMAWPYSKYDFTEPTLTLLVLAALYLILRWGKGGRDSLLLAAGFIALMAAVTKYFAAIVIPIMVLQILVIHWEAYPTPAKLRGTVRPLLLFLVPFLVVAAPAVYYLSQRFGYLPSIFEAWAGVQRGWLPLPFMIGLRGLLFSPGRSFFIYSPPAVLALLSLVPFVRRHAVRSVAILAIILVYFTVYSKKVAWDAGAGWGPRYQVVILPLVVLIAAPLIQKAVEERRRWPQAALLATFVLGMAVNLLAVPKDFSYYLGMFRDRIVMQLPDKGAPYGGGDYFPYAEGLSDANTITATVWAPQFSPILAHAWLLTADALDLARPYLDTTEEKVLGTPPWRLMGIDVTTPNPQDGLGLDFWSMRLWTTFPSHTGLLAGAFVVLLLLEAAVLATGARLVSFLAGSTVSKSRWGLAWLAGSTSVFLLFDGIHFLL